ncbi:MAG: glycosyltransferase [Chloroflexaceae bacterium]|nr:glycosyltransferase [Chloroflexaceae bacterium]
MNLSRRIKQHAAALPPVYSTWGVYRRWQLHHDYARRRDQYAARATQQGLVYREAESIAAVRQHLAQRGYTPTPRQIGDIHTFAIVSNESWHHHLLPDLRELGPLSLFDYVQHGFRWEQFHPTAPHGLERRRAMNSLILPALHAAHAQRPIDWVFIYASGHEMSASTVGRITTEIGCPVVNMCLDDRQSWVGPWMGDHRAGQIDIAAAFDLSWTSARVACEWYMLEGARPFYLAEGFDANYYAPRLLPNDIDISFIGAAYGYRFAVASYLRRHGVRLQTFGRGWPGVGWIDDPVAIINRSQINLGMGGIGYSESLTNVKARDFEIPGTGGGLYITSFHPELARHFVIGQEIVCYRSRDDMLELIRYYLAHPDEAQAIAQRGRARCLQEHRWLHRYIHLCQALTILADTTFDEQ